LTNLPSVPLVVSVLGGNQSVAKILKTTPSAVSNWCAGRKFPAHSYVSLQQRLRDMGMSAPDTLWAMKPKPKQRRKKK